MLNLLLRHKPKDQTDEKFIEQWENMAVSLEPLYKAIVALTPAEKLSSEDLINPNLYAKMVFVQAQRDFSQKILDLFPKSLTNP